MPQRPVVVLICPDRDSYNSGKSTSQSLLHVLHQDHGCEVMTDCRYGEDLSENEHLTKLQLLSEQGRLAAIIIFHPQYHTGTLKGIRRVRQVIDSSVNIYVFVDWTYHDDEHTEKIPTSPDYSVDSWDGFMERNFWTGLSRRIEEVKQNLQAKPQEDALVLQQLRQAYAANHPEEDALAAVDEGSHSAIELMRLRLMGDSRLIHEEFDRPVATAAREENPALDWCGLPQIDEQTYLAEIEKIRRMSDTEREQLDTEIHTAQGQKKLPGGGVRVNAGGLGENSYSLAYDPVTGLMAMTNTFGLHSTVFDTLSELIERVEMLRGNIEFGDDVPGLYHRVIRGLAVKVESFASPIMMPYTIQCSDDDLTQALDFFKAQRRFIVVDHDMRLIS